MLNNINQYILDRHLPTEYPLRTALWLYWRRAVITCVVVLPASCLAAIVAIFIVDAVLAVIIIVVAVIIVSTLIIVEKGEVDSIDDNQMSYPMTRNEIEGPQEENEATEFEPQNDRHSLPPKSPSGSIKWPRLKRRNFDRKS